MSDNTGLQTASNAHQPTASQSPGAKAPVPPLPPLPYLREDARQASCRNVPQSSAARADSPGLMTKPVAASGQLTQHPDIAEIVRKAVVEAIQAFSQTRDSASGAQNHTTGCAACGACTGPGGREASTSGPEPGRSFAGTVVSVDATKLTFGRFPGAPDSVVNIVDVITPRDNSPMGGGYLEWNALSFPWRLTYAEIDVVLEGELHITSGGQTVVGKPGDMLFIPQDTDVIFSSPGHVRFAYVTWPAEWSATIGQPGGGS